MNLKLYNSTTNKVQLFKPQAKGVVKMYTCGPTVYDFVHIGNCRSFIFYDVLHRYFDFSKYKVKHLLNITDVDDKTINGAQKMHLSLWEYTNYYTEEFQQDLKSLGFAAGTIYPAATAFILEMVKIIKNLLKKGYAYKALDGIYFNISKFKNYGKMSKTVLAKNIAGARVAADNIDKQQAADFALWKFYKPEDGEAYWDTELGKGRPGWHIECSAIALKELGPTLDIHAGGRDLKFPHHENEIAQSESYTGKPFANYWLHCEFLTINNKKMSKSLKNFYTLRDLVNKNYNPLAFRLLCYTTHYRAPLNFTLKSLNDAQSTLLNIKSFFERLSTATAKKDYNLKPVLAKYQKSIISNFENDLATPKALASIFNLIKETNKLITAGKLSPKNSLELKKFFTQIDALFGLFTAQMHSSKTPQNILDLVELREQARKDKNYTKADELRSQINQQGYEVEDRVTGPHISSLK